MGNYFVYKITHHEFDEPWYIGISKNPQQRLKQHLTVVTSKIREMVEFFHYTSLEVKLEIIDEAPTLKEARELEKEWIEVEIPILNTQHNFRYRLIAKQQKLATDLSDFLQPYIKDDVQRKEALWKIVEYIQGGTY